MIAQHRGECRNRQASEAAIGTEPEVRQILSRGFQAWFEVRHVVNHAETYVQGQVHTNGLENFWSLLKRNLSGTYVSVEPFHLDRYLDEQMFRFNNRATKDNPLNDADRFYLALSQVAGKRLTYKELTGKTGVQETDRPS